MIHTIEMTGFRGIERGTLDRLSPLTVLVGRNGSGKSTVLDAVLIGTIGNVIEGIYRAATRRQVHEDAVRWLVRNSSTTSASRIHISTISSQVRLVEMTYLGTSNDIDQRGTILSVKSFQPSPNTLQQWIGPEHIVFRDTMTAFPTHFTKEALVPTVRLHDSSSPFSNQATAQLLSDAREHGREEIVQDAIRTASRGRCLGIDLGLNRMGNPLVLAKQTGGAIPLSVAGDGLKLLVQTALELAGMETGVMLLEEPEAHLHPGAMEVLARVIWTTLRMFPQLQVILTTHSIEFVRELLDAGEDQLDPMSVVWTGFADAQWTNIRYSGDEAREQLDDFGRDLR